MTEIGFDETAVPLWLQAYLLLLIGIGIPCLIVLLRRIHTRVYRQPTARVSGWSVRWTDFGLILWAMFASVLILQLILSHFIGIPEDEDSESQAWHIIAAGLTMQIGMILVYVYFRRIQPQLFLEKINSRPVPVARAARTALFVFLASFPAVALTGYY